MDAEPEGRPIVRELTLKRRRSRVPWVYVVYSREQPRGGRVRPAALRAGEDPPSVGQGGPTQSALPAEERRHIEGRVELERVIA